MRRARPKIVKSLVRPTLGPLEDKVMRTVCTLGKCNVRDVVRALGAHRVAYTTVMTTMDRLFQKGLLRRETSGKAYIYRSDMSLSQLENQFARDLIAAFLACGNQPFTVLATALVDLVDAHSPELLAEVEGQIRLRRMKVAYGSMEELALQSWLNSAGEMPLGTA